MAKKKVNKKQALVPEMRFPGFRGDWSYDTLAKVLREHKRKNGEGCTVFSVSLEKGLVNQVEHMGRTFSAKDTSNYNKVSPFDIVYTKSPLRDYPYGIVKQSKLNKDVAVSPLYGVFSPRNKHIGVLVEAYFDSPYRSKRFIGPLAQKGAKNTINITNQGFLAGRLAVPPSEEEQQKIADCLDSLDDLIGAHSAKLDALQDHKKGLLQQLFPAEGKTVPVLRFPEFESGEEWKQSPFGALVKKSFYGTSKSTSAAGMYPVLRMGNMVDGRVDFRKLVYIDLDEKEFKRMSLERGDILLNRTNSAELVGKISIFEGLDKCLSASYIVAFRLKTQIINPHFCNYLLNTPENQARIRALATRSISQCNINPSAFKKELTIRIPHSAEQRRIADCLGALDALIAAQSEQLATLKEHKKGLMQKLFPNPELSQA